MRAGQLIEVSSGNRHAVITEQGATLYRVLWDDEEVLETATEDGWAGAGCHGQLLMPWPGRITAGKYEWDGQSYQLFINDQSHHAAIHGWTRWGAWQVREHRGDRVTMGHRSLANPGYPWALDIEQTYAWSADGLECTTVARNLGDMAAPFGFGAHPYFTVGSPIVDNDVLMVPADTHFKMAEDLTPVGEAVPVDGTDLDFRQPRKIGAAHLDATFSGLHRSADGNVAVKFSRADGSRVITLKYDQSINFVQVYSGDTLARGQREGLAIEPYTCTPNAFNNGMGLTRLNPGGSTRISWAISVS